MNKKGFTLVELIAVVVIMAIIAMIATPNIISMIDKGKKEDFVSNAEIFMSKAVYMYKLDKYKNDITLFEGGNKIKLKNINDVGDIDDPFGGTYDLENSYVVINSENTGSVIERIPSIYIKSCKDTKCHFIGTSASPVAKNNVNVSSITQTK